MAKKTYVYLGISLWILTVIFAVTPIWPYVFYRLSPGTSDTLAATIGNTANVIPANNVIPNSTVIPAKAGIYTNNLDPRVREDDNPPPPFDPSLPKENGLLIEKIGVRGEIHEG